MKVKTAVIDGGDGEEVDMGGVVVGVEVGAGRVVAVGVVVDQEVEVEEVEEE